MTLATPDRVTVDRMVSFVRSRSDTDPLAPPLEHQRALDTFVVTDQPALSLAATVFAWHSEVETDRLYSVERFVEWAGLVGFPALTTPPTEGQLQQLRELREAVFRLTRARIANEGPDPRAVEIVNAAASLPTPVPTLSSTAFARDAAERFDFSGLLSTIARNAIEIVSGPWADRLRQCARQPCTHMFVDRSPSGARRWCTSANCGNRVRAAEFRHRRTT